MKLSQLSAAGMLLKFREAADKLAESLRRMIIASTPGFLPPPIPLHFPQAQLQKDSSKCTPEGVAGVVVCQQGAFLADAYLRGELDEQISEAFELHLMDCSRCVECVELGRVIVNYITLASSVDQQPLALDVAGGGQAAAALKSA